jgi:probable phosphoglycerate mutase
MKKIYILRHGQTEFNKLGMVQGSGIDSDLNEVGILQAEAFYRFYKNIKFDKIYTSKLKRTHQTVDNFINKNDDKNADKTSNWVQLEGLNEVSWGIKEGKPLSEEDNRQYFNMLQAWKDGDLYWKVPGGESPIEVVKRQKKAWQYIMAHTHEREILVCMHGRAIKILLSWLLGTGLANMDNFKHQNTCLYLLSYENGKYTLELENDVKHLADISHIISPKHEVNSNSITSKL